ncbi:MAG: hypothetical protein Q4G51_17615 [Dermatophilus congolensis]|nr:hypothetical protein [Dermatophilus congolensis]
MRGHLARLRGWWFVAALVVAGWAAVAAGQVLVGGAIMAGGCVMALVMRAVAGDDPRLGALILRSRSLDLWFYAVLTANVLGATLLVTRHMEVVVLAAVDAVLLVVGAWIVLRPVKGRLFVR